MYGFLDVNIAHISVIIHKTEPEGFLYRCFSRQNTGFVFVTNGNGYYEDSNGCTPLKKHTLLAFDMGAQYTIRGEGTGFSYITTAFDTTPENCFSVLGIPVATDLSDHPNIAQKIWQLLQVWEERSPLYLLKTRSLLVQILVELFEHCKGNAPSVKEPGRLSAAVDHINRFYDKDLSSEELAKLCNLSVSQFRRRFKQTFGVSPIRYREQVRIYWAKQLLKSELLTVSEIAVKLGYYDIYHFSNDFRKHTGLSPKQYVKGLVSLE